MQISLKLLKFALVISLLVGGFFIVSLFISNKEKKEVEIGNQSLREQPILDNKEKEELLNEDREVGQVEDFNKQEIEISKKRVIGEVPFTSQAPTGNWDDDLFQNGCEEASILMAISWANGKELDSKISEQEIRGISALEIKLFGFAMDTGVDDTARLIREYDAKIQVEVRKNISADEIKKELQQGRIIMLPMEGKLLGNPHYTPPGPDQHMLLVIGYDEKTKEFTTNDPGTKFGKGYRYDEQKLMSAIWNYPTAREHAVFPGASNAEKAMIVVNR